MKAAPQVEQYRRPFENPNQALMQLSLSMHLGRHALKLFQRHQPDLES